MPGADTLSSAQSLRQRVAIQSALSWVICSFCMYVALVFGGHAGWSYVSMLLMYYRQRKFINIPLRELQVLRLLSYEGNSAPPCRSVIFQQSRVVALYRSANSSQYTFIYVRMRLPVIKSTFWCISLSATIFKNSFLFFTKYFFTEDGVKIYHLWPKNKIYTIFYFQVFIRNYLCP